MKAIVLMFDSLNRHLLSPYADTIVDAPNFARLAARAATFDNFYAGSMPCMPARREMHTGRYNFLHRSWGPLEPFDDSMPELLRDAGVHTHLASDHPHYWEDGGATYHTRYSTWEFFRGQEGDPWKGHVSEVDPSAPVHQRMLRQDVVNRSYMPTEAEHSQTLTVDAGLHFLDTNADADRWMLQIELFDPHEPFFAHQQYKDRYPHEYDGPVFDWPGYQKVTEPESQVEHARLEYAALVSMCDRSLGRVLDAMDEHDLWDDTMLIVNTDHGFLLGEHGWWAKSVQPWYNELVHLPMFLWDPRTTERDTRRGELAQTIDIAPTLLRFFDLEPTPDMQGIDLALPEEALTRDSVLFGIHGGHVNVTDGRYVYMRAAADRSNTPLDEYTLMPTHMRSRFAPAELMAWEPSEPLPFTKGVRTMRMPATPGWMNPWQHGTLLFDLSTDPGQEHPLVDDEAELRMMRLLVDALRAADAPGSQFTRLGLPTEGEPGREHLLVRAQRERAAAVAEPLPRAEDLAAHELLMLPLVDLLAVPGARSALEAHVPGLVSTEPVSVPIGMSVLDLARSAALTAAQLLALGDALTKLVPVTA
ncbi:MULTISPECIES: sulfatase [unclassified Rathayibacter]|uniref:sulfatase n=1 Tax=unclassified Rathayibacter TaxID=2609250 RepID=UPI000F4CF6E3|nr:MULTISPECIES: sulfatase [unclassified Rathayibacter]ROP48196.1 arylsulfatase A-like enzyme [Rathayibacter sp. PhB186]ROS48618.1 arylsulfatase A-like enzyme [Rathayibacter sp. PhB185]